MVMAHGLATTVAWTSVVALLSQPIQPVERISGIEGFSQAAAQINLVAISQTTAISQANSRATATVSSLVEMERSILQQINQYRQKKRLSSLRTNPAIRRQARQHSRDMSNRHVLTHNGFDLRVDNISKSIAYRSAAENVAYNWGFSAPERQAVEGWIKSAGHRENIEGDYDLTGIGVAKNAQGEYYFTQIFIKR